MINWHVLKYNCEAQKTECHWIEPAQDDKWRVLVNTTTKLRFA